ncbi:MAG: IS66 family transposase [Candidatus Helarchaeota archaeon]
MSALETLIQTIEAEQVKDDDLTRMFKRLRKFKAGLFTFLKYKDLPHGNNPVEQKVRPFVMQRNVSGTFGSEAELKDKAVHLSIFETCRLNQIDCDQLLNLVFHEKWDEVFD